MNKNTSLFILETFILISFFVSLCSELLFLHFFNKTNLLKHICFYKNFSNDNYILNGYIFKEQLLDNISICENFFMKKIPISFIKKTNEEIKLECAIYVEDFIELETRKNNLEEIILHSTILCMIFLGFYLFYFLIISISTYRGNGWTNYDLNIRNKFNKIASILLFLLFTIKVFILFKTKVLSVLAINKSMIKKCFEMKFYEVSEIYDNNVMFSNMAVIINGIFSLFLISQSFIYCI